MPAHTNRRPGSSGGRPAKAICGICPGGTEHRLLLALRGPGGMTSEQIQARFGYVSAALTRLKSRGLINLAGPGQKGVPATVTEAGRALTDAGAPLSRNHLITYCQL
jgi:hypothetical protein